MTRVSEGFDRMLVGLLQQGIPAEPHPFRACAALAGISEEALVGHLARLLNAGVLTRFGPMYNADRFGGAFTLAAMAVPSEQFERVMNLVNAHPEVAHNYEREHELNMWFVIATEEAGEIDRVIAAIEAETGLAVLSFPKEAEYFVGLQLDLGAGAMA